MATVLSGTLTDSEAWGAINFDTLALLWGMIVLVSGCPSDAWRLGHDPDYSIPLRPASQPPVRHSFCTSSRVPHCYRCFPNPMQVEYIKDDQVVKSAISKYFVREAP